MAAACIPKKNDIYNINTFELCKGLPESTGIESWIPSLWLGNPLQVTSLLMPTLRVGFFCLLLSPDAKELRDPDVPIPIHRVFLHVLDPPVCVASACAGG